MLLLFDKAKLQRHEPRKHGRNGVLFVQIRDDGDACFITKSLGRYFGELFKYPAKIKLILKLQVVGNFFDALPG
jgi:hypothetical protein